MSFSKSDKRNSNVTAVVRKRRSVMIRYIEEKRLFVIETEKMSYVFGISERGV